MPPWFGVDKFSMLPFRQHDEGDQFLLHRAQGMTRASAISYSIHARNIGLE